jgi:hypothetical protein
MEKIKTVNIQIVAVIIGILIITSTTYGGWVMVRSSYIRLTLKPLPVPAAVFLFS